MSIRQIPILQPPFPPGGEAEAIIAIGVMYGIVLMLLIFACLAIFYHNKANRDNYLLQLVIYLFSIFASFGSMSSVYFPFGINMAIFYLLFQTCIFFLSSLKYYTERQNIKKRKRGY